MRNSGGANSPSRKARNQNADFRRNTGVANIGRRPRRQAQQGPRLGIWNYGHGTLESLKGNDFLLVLTGEVCKRDFYGKYNNHTSDWGDKQQAMMDRLTADDYRLLRQGGYSLLGTYDLPEGGTGSVWASPVLEPPSASLVGTLGAAEKANP
jgi:hypothetical protein